jgi:hypothetical protein
MEQAMISIGSIATYVGLTPGNVAQIFASRTWTTETGLAERSATIIGEVVQAFSQTQIATPQQLKSF